MIVEYTGRQFVVSEKYKALAGETLERIEKLVTKAVSAHVILTTDKYRKVAEVTLTCKGQNLVAVCESADMMTALHDALAKLEQQAIRQRQRTTTAIRHPRTAGLRTPVEAPASAPPLSV
jgi:putative sigma-54 modulation protein